jgi:hypothetical protein
MRRLLPLLALTACAAAPSPPPAVAPPAVAPPIDVAGSWTQVPAAAPAGPHVITSCWPNYRAIELVNVNGVLRGRGIRVGHGVQPPPWPLAIAGRWTPEGLVLEGTDGGEGRREGPTRWVLGYDFAQQHLSGTIDGVPASFARLELTRPERCGAPPP